MLQMMLKRQNVSSERVCLFATVWKCAVYKFTHRYTNYLFCAGRLIALICFCSFCLIFLFVISWVHKTRHCPSKTKKEELHNGVVLFFYSAFWKCTLVCSTAVPSRVFALAHTQELLNKSKWMCSFHISCKLHGNHNIFNKLLQKMFY